MRYKSLANPLISSPGEILQTIFREVKFLIGSSFGIFILLGMLLGGANKENPELTSLIILFIITVVFIVVPCYFLWKLYRWFASRRANSAWSKWVKAAQLACDIEKAPVLRQGDSIQECLLIYLPKDGHSRRYTFQTAKEAEDFCGMHRRAIVQRLRSEFSHQIVDEQLALGFVEEKLDKILLLFRQIDLESAVFYAVRHHRIGNIVNLITYHWSVFNRNARRSEGRFASDADIAANRKNWLEHNWRSKAAWGLLGYWHEVDAICRLHNWRHSNGKGSPPNTALADSELAYFEEIIQATVKQVLTQTQSSSNSNSSPVMPDAHELPSRRLQTDYL